MRGVLPRPQQAQIVSITAARVEKEGETEEEAEAAVAGNKT